MEIKRKVWVIMDKQHGVIAKGIPRNRYLVRVDDGNDKKRILTYNSQKIAESNFKTSWFYSGDGVPEYFKNIYGCYYDNELRKQIGPSEEDCMEAVEAELIMKI